MRPVRRLVQSTGKTSSRPRNRARNSATFPASVAGTESLEAENSPGVSEGGASKVASFASRRRSLRWTAARRCSIARSSSLLRAIASCSTRLSLAGAESRIVLHPANVGPAKPSLQAHDEDRRGARQLSPRGMCAVGFFAKHASRGRVRGDVGVLGTRASRPHFGSRARHPRIFRATAGGTPASAGRAVPMGVQREAGLAKMPTAHMHQERPWLPAGGGGVQGLHRLRGRRRPPSARSGVRTQRG